MHSYRYAWAERAGICGCPERFAQEALGHNSKAVPRAYAKRATVRIPSLDEYEQQAQGVKILPFPAALDKVRPGGLVLFITSKGTFNKLDGALREYLSHQADLLGAIRLPNDAFKKQANTEVTTDLVILRKRLPSELPNGAAWKSAGEITNSLGDTLSVNEYAVARPRTSLSSPISRNAGACPPTSRLVRPAITDGRRSIYGCPGPIRNTRGGAGKARNRPSVS